MQEKRPYYGLPFILSMGGVILWIITFFSYFSMDHGRSGYSDPKYPTDPAILLDKWKFLIISASLLLALLAIARWSWRKYTPHSSQQNASISNLLTFCALIVSFLLIVHLLFTVCS